MLKIQKERKKVTGAASEILLSRLNRRCPATMLAASRTERVMGRIASLIDSMNTIKKERLIGVPNGVRWQNMLFVKFSHPYSMYISHRGRLSLREITK